MMTQQFNTKLKGKLVLTDSYHADKTLQKEKSLYKFIWVRSGSITLEIDHQEIMLAKNEIISLSNLQHLEFKSIDGDYLTLLFNSNFYCIYGNDHEVSCSGFLFTGSSHVIRFTLNEAEQKTLNDIADTLCKEFSVTDNLQEEMLRIQLKRFIIQSTRIARHRLNITQEKEYSFEIIRQFFILVLRIIHERIEAEAKRLLLYSTKSSKEIADLLGFEDQSSFSRFFKNMTGQSTVQFRNEAEKQEK